MTVAALTKGDLLALAGGHPVVECEVDASSTRGVGLRSETGWAALVLRPTRTHGTPVDVLGDDAATIVSLLTEPPTARWLDDHRASGATITRPHAPEVITALGTDPAAYTDWEWLVTTRPPAPPAHAVENLDETCREEITSFLAKHSPRSDGRPFAWPGQQWLGVRDPRGQLLGVGCRDWSLGGYPKLTGIATASARRGEGIGRSVTAALTRHALDESSMCTIEHYSDNVVAARLYRDMGFDQAVEWRSGPLR